MPPSTSGHPLLTEPIIGSKSAVSESRAVMSRFTLQFLNVAAERERPLWKVTGGNRTMGGHQKSVLLPVSPRLNAPVAKHQLRRVHAMIKFADASVGPQLSRSPATHSRRAALLLIVKVSPAGTPAMRPIQAHAADVGARPAEARLSVDRVRDARLRLNEDQRTQTIQDLATTMAAAAMVLGLTRFNLMGTSSQSEALGMS